MIGQLDPILKDVRFERKFLPEDGVTPKDVVEILKMHPFAFKETYEQRRVNNIYFDSPDLQSFRSNVDGLKRRYKIRIRWYGETFTKEAKAVLEVKKKEDRVIVKSIYPLPSFSVDQSLTQRVVRDILASASLPDDVRFLAKGMEVQLLNSYLRKYYLSRDRAFRITVDEKMKSYRIFAGCNRFLYRQNESHNVILELKYGIQSELAAIAVCQALPFRISKSSKYVQAVFGLFF